MKASINLTVDVEASPRIAQAGAMFDVPPLQKASRSWEVDLPVEDQPWAVGLIVGPSGAGKSSVARQCFAGQPEPEWDAKRSVLDCFPQSMGIRSIVDLLTSVGFGSPPAWMRPYQTLSTGEQFRVDCARRLAEAPQGEVVLIDEFTSVVDRQVAQVASHTLQKTVRRSKRQLIAVTCHYDVVEWLQPDWIYQPHAEEFTWRSVQPRPRVDLDIYSINHSAWRVFAPHHYLSAYHMPGAKCFGLFIKDECVAFQSYRHFMHPHTDNLKICHRLVVLPDWQGLGLAGRFADWLGQHLYDLGWRYRIVTAHPAMIRSFNQSPRWRLADRANRLQTRTRNRNLAKAQLDPRRLNTCSFEYMAPVRSAVTV
jgi:GNAT superfamily N-acetyltransferase